MFRILAGRRLRASVISRAIVARDSMDSQTILIHLALKLGVAAAVSSSLVRSKEFKLLLFREERTFRQKVYLALCIALPIMAGVWIRLSVKSFLAGDLSFETALLLGVIGGRWAGSLGGVLIGHSRLAHRVGGGKCFAQRFCCPSGSMRITGV